MVTIATLEELKPILQKELVLVIAKTHRCSVCATVESQLRQGIEAFDTLESVAIYIDDHEPYRGFFEMFTVPTVMVYSQGKELLRESRFINVAKIQRLIESFQS